MQLIDFKVSLSWASKFDDLQKSLETAENSQTSISTCWKSLPEKFDCLKKMAIALLSVFVSTYLCEQLFSHMKFIFSSHRSRLTEDHSKACVQLKVTKYSPNTTELSKVKNLIKNYSCNCIQFLYFNKINRLNLSFAIKIRQWCFKKSFFGNLLVSGCFGFTFHAKPSLKNFDFYTCLYDVFYFYPLLQAKSAKKAVTLQPLMIESRFLA